MFAGLGVPLTGKEIVRCDERFASAVVVSMQGKRMTDEDASIVLAPLSRFPHSRVSGVFDGHNGQWTAIALARNISDYIGKLDDLTDESLRKAFLGLDSEILKSWHGDNGSTAVTVIIQQMTTKKRRWADSICSRKTSVTTISQSELQSPLAASDTVKDSDTFKFSDLGDPSCCDFLSPSQDACILNSEDLLSSFYLSGCVADNFDSFNRLFNAESTDSMVSLLEQNVRSCDATDDETEQATSKFNESDRLTIDAQVPIVEPLTGLFPFINSMNAPLGFDGHMNPLSPTIKNLSSGDRLDRLFAARCGNCEDSVPGNNMLEDFAAATGVADEDHKLRRSSDIEVPIQKDMLSDKVSKPVYHSSVSVPEAFLERRRLCHKAADKKKRKTFAAETEERVGEVNRRMSLNYTQSSAVCTPRGDGGSDKETTTFLITVCNVGDSRALLLRKSGKWCALTRDHHPSDPLEKQRIERAGGTIICSRINAQMAVSRSFGDRVYKQNREKANDAQLVIAVPDIRVQEASAGDIIVIACDGVFESFTNKQLMNFVWKKLQKPLFDLTECALEIVDSALVQGSMDNITVQLIQLHEDTKSSEIKRVEKFIPGISFGNIRENKRLQRLYTAECNRVGVSAGCALSMALKAPEWGVYVSTILSTLLSRQRAKTRILLNRDRRAYRNKVFIPYIEIPLMRPCASSLQPFLLDSASSTTVGDLPIKKTRQSKKSGTQLQPLAESQSVATARLKKNSANGKKYVKKAAHSQFGNATMRSPKLGTIGFDSVRSCDGNTTEYLSQNKADDEVAIQMAEKDKIKLHLLESGSDCLNFSQEMQFVLPDSSEHCSLGNAKGKPRRRKTEPPVADLSLSDFSIPLTDCDTSNNSGIPMNFDEQSNDCLYVLRQRKSENGIFCDGVFTKTTKSAGELFSSVPLKSFCEGFVQSPSKLRTLTGSTTEDTISQSSENATAATSTSSPSSYTIIPLALPVNDVCEKGMEEMLANFFSANSTVFDELDECEDDRSEVGVLGICEVNSTLF